MENLEQNLPEEIPANVEPGGEGLELSLTLSPDLRNGNIIVDKKLLKIFQDHPDTALRIKGNPIVEVLIYIKDFRNEELPED
jgi:hypothetical protein